MIDCRHGYAKPAPRLAVERGFEASSADELPSVPVVEGSPGIDQRRHLDDSRRAVVARKLSES